MSYIEQHIIIGGVTAFKFVRRPVAGRLPDDGWIGFVEYCPEGTRLKNAVGRWRHGKWDNGKGRDLPFEPTHWTTVEPSNDAG